MLNDDVIDNATTEASADSSGSAPKRRRRAASRPAGPPASVAAPVAAPEAAAPEAAAPEPQLSEAAPAEAVEVKKTTRRRRKPTTEAVEQTTETPAETTPTPTEETPEVATKPARRSRRRSAAAEPVAEATETAPSEGAADEIGAKLAEAEQQAASRPKRSRRKVQPTLASPFLAPDADTEDVLQGLAASIAGVAPATFGVTPVAVEPDAEAVDGEEPEADAADSDDVEPGDAPEDEAAADETPEDEAPDDDTGEDETGEDDASDEEASEDEGSDDDGTPNRRRRRRRGGRRRRRGSDAEAEADDEVSEATDEDAAEDETADDSADATDEDGSSSSRRRRRRRRRRGEDTAGAEDDPSDVVVRVREPRRSKKSDEVTGIEGSTRMEAKRQRRREGRAAGRRRAPILSEAEFLARRESVERRMVIRQQEEYTQLAVLEDGILVEHYVDRKESASMIGNVYLGRVQNVLPSMEAAFIDIGRGRNAVLYAGEVDWQALGAVGEQRKVEKVLKSGQTVLVQVSKDPVGAKGARLTSHIALPGRYVVYSPGGHLSGISRKLSDTERNRLKGILSELISEDSSVIVRTAAEGASEDELVRDVNRLKAQWEVIEKKVKQGSAPQLLYGEPDLTVRIVRDLFTEDFTELVVQGSGEADDVHDAINSYVGHVAPHLAERLKRWDVSEGDIFAHYKLDQQIAKALERKVFLPSGGSLVIDRTEAMTVIDVNTGRFTGTSGNLEATVTSNNLEAAEEIVRQLRLRDIGGIIVIDFIDMVLPSNRELLIRRLVECLGRDRTRHQVAEVSSLGLVQMTRKKIGTGLAEAFTEECEHCGGRGYHRFEEPVESQAPADGGDRRAGRSPSSGRGRRSRRGEGEGRGSGRGHDSAKGSSESDAESGGGNDE